MTKPLTLAAWLARWRRRRVSGRCFEATREGLQLFPAMSFRVGCVAIARTDAPTTILDFRGLVHCWMVSPDGTVVDPTAHQYGAGLRAKDLEYWPFRRQIQDIAAIARFAPEVLRQHGLEYPPRDFASPEKDAAVLAPWMTLATGWPTHDESEAA